MADLGDLLRRELEGGWFPQSGRQAEAYNCEADELFYGGAAGGGKTDLLLGLAHTAHQRSIIFRREYSQLLSIEERSHELFDGRGSYNGQKGLWKLDDGRQIEFGAVQLEGDVKKFQGRPHDLKAFDEITSFTLSQFRFLAGWLRTPDPIQRTRIVCTGNPPTDAEGDWVIKYWGPWLDEQHPNPAAPGELRWFAMIAGVDTEVAGPEPIEHDGDLIYPKSRTFIPARIEDNPILMASGYRRQLQALPEPLRSKMLLGDFGVGQEDDPWQVIPTAWIKAAQARWTSEPAGPMDALGVDVARGGKDRTVLTPRHAHWFGAQQVHPGSSTPDGPAVVGLVVAAVGSARPAVNVDVIGVGYAVEDVGKMQGLHIVSLNGAAGTQARDRAGQLGFLNKRAWWYWSLREALDPAGGDDLALPPDRELLADLAAPRWRLTARGVQVESKEDIKARIGRSPDKGDSLVYAHAQPDVKGAAFLELVRRETAGWPQSKGAEASRPEYAPGSMEWAAQQMAGSA